MDMFEEFEELAHILSSFGIQKGDVVYVAADITKLMYHANGQYGCETKVEFDKYLHQFVNALQYYIGSVGTLLFPIYTWDFCRGKPFSIKKSKGEVGALSNWVLENRADFQRTQHPMYSFMVWGKDKKLLAEMKNRDAWGKDSPFAYLQKRNAKVLMVDLPPSKCFTFFHYIERYLNVPWRYMKDFSSLYTDQSDYTERRIYSMFVRDLDIQSKIAETFDSLFEQSSILQRACWADILLYCTTCAEAFGVCVDDLKNNKAKMCYQFEGYVPNWESGPTHPDVLIND